MDKVIFSGILAFVVISVTLWIFIGDLVKVNLFFPWMRGGVKTRDKFDLLETVSVEVRRVGHDNAHSQSYIFKNPDINSDPIRYQASGVLESVDQGRIPVRFDICKVFTGLYWVIDFKISFDSELSGVEMVKAWCWVKGERCIVIDGKGYHRYNIDPAPAKWELIHKGDLQSVRFANSRGDVRISRGESTQFVHEQVWKHKAHSEYVSLWIMDPNGITIEKGTIFEGCWNLKFRSK